LEDSKTSWTEPEWGFPKGRKNHYETDLLCALREYEEETGYDSKELELIRNILPYEEIFIGSNYKSYKHKYFVARSKEPIQKRPFQLSEVSNLQWFSYEEALEKIRPYNIERKQIVTMVHTMLEEYIEI
jgi:8-oxo-dGTP pyrophosphatase MutT (NUDIX family)